MGKKVILFVCLAVILLGSVYAFAYNSLPEPLKFRERVEFREDVEVRGRLLGASALKIGNDVRINGELNMSGVAVDGTGKVLCIKSDGNIGTCTNKQDPTGLCTCV